MPLRLKRGLITMTNQKMHITKREQILIIVLASLVAVACLFFFIINPMISTYNQNAEAMAQLISQKKENDELLAQQPELEQSISEYEQKIRTNSSSYYSFKETWEAEREITKLAAAHNFNITRISLSETSSDTSNSGENKADKSIVRSCSANVECTTTLQDINSFLAGIQSLDKKAYINGWSYGIQESGVTFSFTIVLYSIIPE